MRQSASLPAPDALLVGWRQRIQDARGVILVAVAYFIGAEIAFFIGTLSDRIFAPFWPPNVILFCVLAVVPERRWWLYIAAVFPAHVLAELRVAMPVAPLLVAFITNCLVAAGSALAIRRLIGPPPWFSDLRKASLYVLITAGVSPGLVALAGAFVPILSGGSTQNFWQYAVCWYAANALPSLTIGPAVLITLNEGARAWLRDRARAVEALVLAVALVAVCALAFQSSGRTIAPGFLPVVLYSPLPLMLWATVRFGARGASIAVLLVTVVLVARALEGPSLFLHGDAGTNVLALQVFLIGLSIPTLLLGAAIDDVRTVERTMRRLAGSLLQAQDEERRRIARELHDSTGQNLIAAGMLLHRVRDQARDPADPAIAQLEGVIKQSVQELRTMSYLLHPPLLDEAGLPLALRHYVDGFSRRSGLTIDLDLAADLPRPALDVELVLFRVVQEALTNVSRHSGSATASIRLARSAAGGRERLVLTIEDEGDRRMHGRAAEATRGWAASGVGLASMQERLQQIGGALSIKSGLPGTQVTATVSVTSDDVLQSGFGTPLFRVYRSAERPALRYPGGLQR